MNKLWIAATLGAALALAGCDKLEKASQSAPQNGPYTITPVANTTFGSGLNYYRAWRLDTKTGELSLCTVEIDQPNQPEKAQHDCVSIAAPAPVGIPEYVRGPDGHFKLKGT